ncbi:MAG TPA: hypothetical protein VF717_09300 [Pyrinomonadaceae bacterium]|jgi:hypothetical protein
MAKRGEAIESGGFTMQPFTSADIDYMVELTRLAVSYEDDEATTAFALLIAGIAATDFDRETLACFIIETALSKSREIHYMMSDYMNKESKRLRKELNKGGSRS